MATVDGPRMSRGLAALILSFAAPVLVAQTKPVVAPGAPVGARAAFVVSVLERVARERDDPRAARRGASVARELVSSLQLVGYRSVFVHAAAAGERLTAARSWGFEVPDGLDAERWAFYALPIEATEQTLFVAAVGPVLWSEGMAASYRGQVAPAPDAALGRGGDGTWAALQRSAGMGEDGDMWQPTSLLPRTTCDCVVGDREGTPLSGAEVWLMPVDGTAMPGLPVAVPLPGTWPAGVAEIDRHGRASLSGVPATGLGLRARLASTWLVLDDGAVRCEGSSLRVTVPVTARDPQRMAANEAAAFATLKNISSAQAQCQASGVIDVDGDGIGEFGFFAELAGAAAVRSDEKGGVGDVCITPPVLSTAFSRVSKSVVRRSGYCFQLFLCDSEGRWCAEDGDGGSRGVGIAADSAERKWCCLAWPERHGWSGTRAFHVDQDGDVRAAENREGAWSGTGAPVPWTTAEPPPEWVVARAAPPK